MRSTRSIEVLCLALAALVLVWSRALTAQLWPVLGLLSAFAIAIVVFRARRFFPRRTRTKLQIESWSMVIFITGVLWFTGKSSSPLLNLYLLPIILSALTLGRFVSVDFGALGDTGPDEVDRRDFGSEHARKRLAITLTDHDDDLALA